MACNCSDNGKTINIEMGCCVPIVANADAYYTKSQVDEKIDEIISSGCCITPEEVDEKISAATDGLASEEWVDDQRYLTDADLSDYALKTDIPTVPTSNTAFTNDAGYITQDSITGKADTTAVTEVNNTLTAHTANTNIHITTAQSAAWDAKSNFSGDYNDLTNKPTIPTVPTSNTAFTNDAGYITIDAISGKADTSAVTEELSSKQDTLVSGTNIKTINNTSLLGEGNITIEGGGTVAIDPTLDSGSTNAVANSAITIAIDEKQDVSGMTAYTTTATTSTLNAVVTAHTANTDIHITTAQSAAWDAKSNFSGSYNDLSDKPTIPTVPTSNTAFTNDAGYQTATDVSNALSGYAESSAVTEEIAEATSGLQETLVSGTNIKTINNLSLLGEGNITIEGGGGGGGVYNAGRGIAIDSSNIISSTLPIYSGSVADSVIIGDSGLTSTGQFSIVGGFETSAISECSFVVGNRTKAINNSEAALGHYNVSNSGSSEIFFGDDRNTLFSVGNGYTTAQRHNAVEIRQNGDIYISDTNDETTEYYYEKPMIKLQDALIVDQELNNASSKAIANSAVTIAIDEKQDASGMTAYTTTATTSALNGVVTAHTANTLIHVTQEEKSAWNAKSDFSGDYNDLTNKPTIPTVPTSNTAFTNDANYITIDAISGKADTSAVTEVRNTLDVHTANTYIHVSASEKTNWNNKVDNTTYTAYTASTNTALNGKVDSSTFRVYSATTDAALSGKADSITVAEALLDKQDVSGMTAYTTTATTSALNAVVTAHTANTDIHITTAQSAAWDAKCETPTYHTVTLNADGSVRSAASTLVYSTIKANLQDPQKADYLELLWENGVGSSQYSRLLAKCVGITNTENGLLRFEATFVNGDGLLMIIILTLDSENTLSTFGVMISPETTLNKVQSVVSNSTSTVFYPSAKAIFDEFQRKPVVIWENTENSGLTSSEQNISTSMTWQLTNLDMTPYKRIKIYTKAGRKDSGVGVDASNTPAVVLEMSLDDRAKSPVGGHFLGSVCGQKPNDTNRLFTVVCAISSDKTSFAVLRMTTLYGTAATTNSDCNGYVFKIEGYFD